MMPSLPWPRPMPLAGLSLGMTAAGGDLCYRSRPLWLTRAGMVSGGLLPAVSGGRRGLGLAAAEAAVLAAIFGGLRAIVRLAFQPRTAAIPYAPAFVLGAWVSWIGGGS